MSLNEIGDEEENGGKKKVIKVDDLSSLSPKERKNIGVEVADIMSKINSVTDKID